MKRIYISLFLIFLCLVLVGSIGFKIIGNMSLFDSIHTTIQTFYSIGQINNVELPISSRSFQMLYVILCSLYDIVFISCVLGIPIIKKYSTKNTEIVFNKKNHIIIYGENNKITKTIIRILRGLNFRILVISDEKSFSHYFYGVKVYYLSEITKIKELLNTLNLVEAKAIISCNTYKKSFYSILISKEIKNDINAIFVTDETTDTQALVDIGTRVLKFDNTLKNIIDFL